MSVDDEFGNEIANGLQTYDEAKQVARRYLAEHPDAPCAEIIDGNQTWVVTREESVGRK